MNSLASNRKNYSESVIHIFFRITIPLLLLNVFGCRLDNEPITPIESRSPSLDSLVEYEYRIDNSIVSPFTIPEFTTDSTSIYLYETGLFSSYEYHTKTIIHKFTSTSEYYDYAEYKGIQAELHDLVLDSLSKLAIKFNMDSILVADNEIPEWWMELETSVYNGVLNGLGSNTIRPRSLVTQLNEDWRGICKGQHGDGNNQIFTLPGIGMPSLGLLGWRNRVSGMTPFFLGGVNYIYRRAFYVRRIATIWSWGLTTTDFCGPLLRVNNASNSWLNFGI